MLSFFTVWVNTISLYYVAVRDRLIIRTDIQHFHDDLYQGFLCPIADRIDYKKNGLLLFVLPVCLSSQEVESAAALSSRMKGAGGVGGGWQQEGRSSGPPPPPGGKSKLTPCSLIQKYKYITSFCLALVIFVHDQSIIL